VIIRTGFPAVHFSR